MNYEYWILTILAWFWTYVKTVQQTVTVQDFTFKTDSSFFIFSLGSMKLKNNTHSFMALILGDLNSLWFRYQSSQNYMPTGHTIKKINTNNVRCEVTGLVIIITTQIVSSSRIFYEIWQNVGFTVPRNKFLSVGRGKFYAKISRFRQQQLT